MKLAPPLPQIRITQMGTLAENIMNSRLTLTQSEVKNIMKVIRFLENRGMLLKGTTQNSSQESRFF